MLGHPASWHTVCSPSDFTSDLSAAYSGPIRARVLIHSGLRSIGVSALRTSRRSSLRPSGVALTQSCYGGSGNVAPTEREHRRDDGQHQENAQVGGGMAEGED